VIRVSESFRRRIKEHARQTYPYECCGILLGRVDGDLKVVTEIRGLDNEHEEGHERRYLISPQQMFEVQRDARARKLDILGVYHSHPDHPNRYSEYDRSHAWPWYSYIIVSVLKGEPKQMRCWILSDDQAKMHQEKMLP
jgi:proteasome lid subunit RPN8/RPN11